MEKIDLNNYEAYFLDFMEGTLSAEEKHDLFAFLESHPELMAEMEEDFGVVELIPEKVQFAEKDALKIDEGALIITSATVDDLMIAAVEGQLTAHHKAELAAYVKAEGLEETYAYYQATVLKPDMTLVYSEKQKLKVKTGVVISLPWVARVASIAAVGLILITVAVQNWNGPGTTIETEGVQNSIFAGNPKDHVLLDLMKQQRNAFDPMQENEINQFQETYEGPRRDNRQPNNLENELINEELNNAVAENGDNQLADTSRTNPAYRIVPNDVNPDNILEDKDFADKDDQDDSPNDENITIPVDNSDDVAAVKKEEPYKIVTDLAENIVNRDVKFTRDKDLASNDYVAYGFKLGKFEFERKRSNR